MIKPTKLKIGDEIRIIAPSNSIDILSQETLDTAVFKLTELGFKITFGNHCSEKNIKISMIQDKVSDIHDAFSDVNVKAILTVIGGYNSNQLLDYLDYDLISKNPKIFCGYSDITTLLNAFNTQSNLVTYYGPHFSSFGMKRGFEYSIGYFKKMLMENYDFDINPSENWSDDLWFLDQENREFLPNNGMSSIVEGYAEGRIVGGNISTFNLLAGTKYFPELKDSILILEAHSEVKSHHFDRLLQQLIQQPNFNKIRGLIIGMFQKQSSVTIENLNKIIHSKQELLKIPVIANANFGHITPIATIPLGGFCEIKSFKNNCIWKIKV